MKMPSLVTTMRIIIGSWFFLLLGVLPARAVMPVLFDARAMGMGDAYTALSNESTSLQWNPGGLGDLRRRELSALYSKGLLDTQYMSLSYGHPFSWGGMAVGWGRLGNEFERTSAQDETLGTGAVGSDVAMLGVGYYRLPVSLGISGRYISEKVDPVSLSGYALDLGALYERGPCRFGWVWKNACSGALHGNGLLGDTVNEDMPPVMNAGISYARPFCFDIRSLGSDASCAKDEPDLWRVTLTAAIDVQLPVYKHQEALVSSGVEMWVNDLVAVRTGLSQGKEYRVGMSLKASGFRFDYAFLMNPQIAHTHVLSTSLYFGS